MRLADYVMSFVAGQGVKHVFLLTGGGAMHLDDALARRSGLTGEPWRDKLFMTCSK